MRICLVYDCLYPHTVGGAERWYGSVAERLVADGHDVTYLTLRQWDRGETPGGNGVNVVAVGPRMALYTKSGRRRILPPIVFGAGVFLHLLRNRRCYDTVHTASFPYFSLLAAGAMRHAGRYGLIVDWHEVWSRDYWTEYLGARAGDVGWAIQRLCARIPQRALCFSQLHASRLRDEGLRGEVIVLSGEYDGPVEMSARVGVPDPLVVFAGRMIPEKRAPAVVAAIAEARTHITELRGALIGDGPERGAVLSAVSELKVEDVVEVPGFIAAEEVQATLARALCMLLPSRREGYGRVVIEAASHGTPSIVVAEPDNAAVELISEGQNGFIAASASAEDLAREIRRVQEGGQALRESTAAWFRDNVETRLSIASSLELVSDAYRSQGRDRGG